MLLPGITSSQITVPVLCFEVFELLTSSAVKAAPGTKVPAWKCQAKPRVSMFNRE